MGNAFFARVPSAYLRIDLLNIASAFCAAASARCAAASARLAAASARCAAASTIFAFDAQAWQAEVSTFSQQPVANVNANRPPINGALIVLNVVLIDTFTSSRKRRVSYSTNGRGSQGVNDEWDAVCYRKGIRD
jgi:hypothetical protein